MHGEHQVVKGSSGRIVVEIDTNLKRELYAALALEGSTFKDWLIQRADKYVTESRSIRKKQSSSS